MTRKTLSPLSMLAFTSMLLAVPVHGQFLYVTNLDSNNVSAYTIDATTGALTPVKGSPFSTGIRPTSITMDPNTRFAYIAYESNLTNSGVAGYSVNSATGVLNAMPSSPFSVTTGTRPRNVAVDPTGKFAYSANYQGTGVSGYAINVSNGALSTMSGGSAFAAGSNPASVAIDPTGKFAYVANTGSNTVTMYSIDAATGSLTNTGSIPAGSHPFAVAAEPSGRFVYVANDGSDNVSAYSIHPISGVLTAIASPVPAGDFPCSITVDPTGTHVYVANQLSDSVSAYQIDASSGGLSPIPGSPFKVPSLSFGTGAPTSVVVEPSGKFAYVTRYYGNDIVAYSIKSDGALVELGSSFRFPAGTGPYAMAAPVATRTADLSVAMSGSAQAAVRDTVTYNIVVINNGPFAANNVTLDDDVPADTKFVSNPGADGWSCTNPRTKGARNGVISCNIPSLASGASATFTITVEVAPGTKAGDVITNTTALSSFTPDLDNTNNSASATTTVFKR